MHQVPRESASPPQVFRPSSLFPFLFLIAIYNALRGSLPSLLGARNPSSNSSPRSFRQTYCEPFLTQVRTHPASTPLIMCFAPHMESLMVPVKLTCFFRGAPSKCLG